MPCYAIQCACAGIVKNVQMFLGGLSHRRGVVREGAQSRRTASSDGRTTQAGTGFGHFICYPSHGDVYAILLMALRYLKMVVLLVKEGTAHASPAPRGKQKRCRMGAHITAYPGGYRRRVVVVIVVNKLREKSSEACVD